MAIGGYSINDYWGLLVAILLMTTSDDYIISHWWLFY
jgi:hypothetical protein